MMMDWMTDYWWLSLIALLIGLMTAYWMWCVACPDDVQERALRDAERETKTEPPKPLEPKKPEIEAAKPMNFKDAPGFDTGKAAKTATAVGTAGLATAAAVKASAPVKAVVPPGKSTSKPAHEKPKPTAPVKEAAVKAAPKPSTLPKPKVAAKPAAQPATKKTPVAKAETKSVAVKKTVVPAKAAAPKAAAKPAGASKPKAAAPAAALGAVMNEAGKPKIRGAGKGKADDLELIKGVGPKLNTLLISLGVTRFAQIASWTKAEIVEVDQYLGNFTGRIARDNWVDQAGYLAKGDLKGFAKKYGEVGSEIKK